MVGMKPSLISTLPPALRRDLADVLATEAGFAAMVGRKVERFAPPVTVERALAWLEKQRAAMRVGHVSLADGRILYFHPVGFLRVERAARRRADHSQ
jgi:hypothetical protein